MPSSPDARSAAGEAEAVPEQSPARRSPRNHQASPSEALERRQREMSSLAELPWCGQAQKLGATEKEILSHFKHSVVLENKMFGGRMCQEPSIRYRSKYESTAGRDRVMSYKGLNATRLGELLLKSDSTPDDVKEKIGKKMRSKFAKEFMNQFELKRKAEIAEPSGELEMKRKACKLDGQAQAHEDERQGALERYLVRDPPMPEGHFNLCVYYMAVWFIMSRIPFLVADSPYFRKFLLALRPNFEKQLSSEMRLQISGPLLDEVYEEAKLITNEKLTEVPGRTTIGIDGHKLGNRHLETITRCKLGVSTFHTANLLGRQRATGRKLADILLPLVTNSVIAVVADNTSNNTGSRTGLFARLLEARPTLLCVGCCVHVLDLLIEDLAKLEFFAATSAEAHFLTSFSKKHAILYEELLVAQKAANVKANLTLFPLTRFAYVYLMCQRVVKNWLVLRHVSESDTFAVLKEIARKRGSNGAKSFAEFLRFEELTDSRHTKEKLVACTSVLEPFSAILHYLEGDSTPISHVYPCYQLLYDFSQNLSKVREVSAVVDEEHQESICNATRERWLGVGRKTGLQDDLHLCAFALDPYIQAALTKRSKPECDLFTTDVMEAARKVFKHISSNAAERAVLVEQFGLWCAAVPCLSIETGRAAVSGHNSYSSLYLTAMELMWDKLSSVLSASTSTAGAANAAPTSPTSLQAIKSMLTAFKMCRKPTEFWLSMQAEAPRGNANEAARESHRFFCKVACNLVAIVGHTAGVERAGKGYGMVFTQLRKSLDEQRALKSVYILENYGLLQLSKEDGGGVQDFTASTSTADAPDDIASALPRGNLIMNETAPDDPEEEWDDEVDDNGDADTVCLSWGLPDGFKVANKPARIDSSCVGSIVYLNWENLGWHVGKVIAMITPATPRLFLNYNVRVAWEDARGPTMLDLDHYQGGEDAPFNSWVFLVKDTESEEEVNVTDD